MTPHLAASPPAYVPRDLAPPCSITSLPTLCHPFSPPSTWILMRKACPPMCSAGGGGRGGDRHGIAALELGAAAEARLCAGDGTLPVLPAGDAAHHRRHHAGRGPPEDPPASETVCRPTSYCRSPCPPGSLRLVLRLTAPGVSQTQPCWLAYGCHRALVCSWACNAPSPGPWVGRHGRPACASRCGPCATSLAVATSCTARVERGSRYNNA